MTGARPNRERPASRIAACLLAATGLGSMVHNAGVRAEAARVTAVQGSVVVDRIDDVADLPPAFVTSYQVDPTRDEGLHYALTLRHWLDRATRARRQIEAMYDERFFRMWEFYLAGGIVMFESGAAPAATSVAARQ